MKIPIAAVIMAAGLGTRMKSDIPKVLHLIAGKPLINYIVNAVKNLKTDTVVVVGGQNLPEIKNALSKHDNIVYALQRKPEGTADALKAALPMLKNFKGAVLVLNGDTPLITSKILKDFLSLHLRRKEDLSLISFAANGRHSYGRIIRQGGAVKAIVEDKDADESLKKINEVNSGIYAMNCNVLSLLKDIRRNEKKGEYYLTDIVDIAVKKGFKVDAHIMGSGMEMTGINTREELYRAGIYMRDRIVRGLMDKGVSFIDAKAAFISPDAQIGADTIIYPNVHIEGKTIIGKSCVIHQGSRITDSIIGDHTIIKDCTVIESSTIKDNASIGPFAHIRPGSVIDKGCKVGNFVELKKAILKEGVKASHLSYLGDVEIGRNANIGAGTITCNYDGKNKHKTVIEDNVFIGSDTQLIAPVKIGKGSYIGAGSTITNDVPPHSLGISRVQQKNIVGWAKKREK
jgi:bifunctional UDP-N-acetylglucosamine pyrophosphorylase/glucosamine-1-phosphate N-acetyltransferase